MPCREALYRGAGDAGGGRGQDAKVGLGQARMLRLLVTVVIIVSILVPAASSRTCRACRAHGPRLMSVAATVGGP